MIVNAILSTDAVNVDGEIMDTESLRVGAVDSPGVALYASHVRSNFDHETPIGRVLSTWPGVLPDGSRALFGEVEITDPGVAAAVGRGESFGLSIGAVGGSAAADSRGRKVHRDMSLHHLTATSNPANLACRMPDAGPPADAMAELRSFVRGPLATYAAGLAVGQADDAEVRRAIESSPHRAALVEVASAAFHEIARSQWVGDKPWRAAPPQWVSSTAPWDALDRTRDEEYAAWLSGELWGELRSSCLAAVAEAVRGLAPVASRPPAYEPQSAERSGCMSYLDWEAAGRPAF